MVSKGDAVKVVSGKQAGASGTVFFNGVTRFGKERVGVKTAEGDIWVAPYAVALASAVEAAPVVAPVADAGLAAKVAALEAQVAVLMALVAGLTAKPSLDAVEQAVADAVAA